MLPTGRSKRRSMTAGAGDRAVHASTTIIEVPCKAAGLGRDRPCRIGQIRICEDVGEVEAALANEVLWIDREPAARAEVEHVVVVQVAVQNHDLTLIAEQCLGNLGRAAQDAAMRSGGGP